jgi:hypothetical protein
VFKEWTQSLLSSAYVSGRHVSISNVQNTFEKESHDIKLGFENYVVIMQIEELYQI